MNTSIFHFEYQQPLKKLMLGLIFLWVLSLPLSMALMNICASLLFFIYIFSGSYGEKYQDIKGDSVILIWLAFFIWTVLAGFYSSAPWDLLWHNLFRYKKILLLPVLIWVLRGQCLNTYVFVYLLALLFMIAFTVAEGHGMVTSWQTHQYVYTPNPLRNYITEGFFIAVGLFAALWFLKNNIKPRLMIFLVLIFLVHIAFNNGRMGLISAACALMMFIFFAIKNPNLKVVGLCLLLLGIVGAYFLSPLIQTRVDRTIAEAAQIFNFNSADSIRLQYWKNSWTLFITNPILGHGPGAFKQMILSSGQVGEYPTHLHAHNEYIMVALQYGLIGFGLLIAALHQSLRKFSVAEVSPAQMIGFVGVLIFLLNCLTDAFLFNDTEGYAFIFFLALMLSQDKKQVAQS